jgi:signal transduction histidine kinase
VDTIAGIAHDINNQLTLIVNYLSLPDLDRARTAVDRCAALTAILLDDRNEIAAMDPVRFLHEFLAQLALPKGIHLETDIPNALPAIRANPLALSRALTNLIANAAVAMNDQGTLTITAAPQTIEVTDSGPGIPPHLGDSIFEPGVTTKGANGRGLGLTIVRELMRQQGGEVKAQKSTFTLTFRPGPYGETFNPSPRKIAPAA